MDKFTKKRINYNEYILFTLKSKYGYSLDYIRKSLRGDRTGIMPDKLIAEYNKMKIESKKAIEKAAREMEQGVNQVL